MTLEGGWECWSRHSGTLFLTILAAILLLFASGRFWVFHGSD